MAIHENGMEKGRRRGTGIRLHTRARLCRWGGGYEGTVCVYSYEYVRYVLYRMYMVGEIGLFGGTKPEQLNSDTHTQKTPVPQRETDLGDLFIGVN